MKVMLMGTRSATTSSMGVCLIKFDCVPEFDVAFIS
jgi:hypothetical protein